MTDTSSLSRDSNPALHDIRQGLIGEGITLNGHFGARALVYADYVASGRALTQIEDFVRDEVLPVYGNTHSTSSATGRQMTVYREEARSIVAKHANASHQDAVIFTGSGATGAINLFVQAMMRRPDFKKPLVLLGPYEHNSNRLIWREMDAEVVCINEAALGGVDLDHLEAVLSTSKHKFKIGSFSAASNVTGALTDTVAVTKLLHQYGALACFDYAAAAPYMPIDVNPEDAPKDAIFISAHKLVGGVGAPGILIVKKNLMCNEIPVVPAGGTVHFVDDKAHQYLDDIEAREEGGTPDILGSIRAGLAFRLKDSIGADIIEQQEHAVSKHALERLTAHPSILVLGSSTNERLPTFSFMIRHGDAFLHHEFVTVLLNDLFGIQSRGGCACAGPYSMFLLGIEDSKPLLDALNDGSDIVKPGFSRFSLPYFFSRETISFILDAVLFVADNGWKFLPHYQFDNMKGTWVSRDEELHTSNQATKSLKQFSVGQKRDPAYPSERPSGSDECIKMAEDILQNLLVHYPSHVSRDDADVPDQVCWYLRPDEALKELRKPEDLPFRAAHLLRPVYNQQQPFISSTNKKKFTKSLEGQRSKKKLMHSEKKISGNVFKRVGKWMTKRRSSGNSGKNSADGKNSVVVMAA